MSAAPDLLSVKYLREYQEKLNRVTNTLRSTGGTAEERASILYDEILPWQSARMNHGKEAQDEINRICSLSGASELQSAHLPTTAIGSFGDLVVIAANPHYHEDRNTKEMSYRVTQGKNREWCKEFFSTAKEHTKDLAWWKLVVEFAYTALNGSECKLPEDLWDWAAQGLVGAVDLVPFHSSADGVTKLIECQPSAQTRLENPEAARIRDALRMTASETLKMVLAFEPKVLIIASKAGFNIASKIQHENQEDFWCDEVGDQWVKYRYKVTHVRTVAQASRAQTHAFMMPSQLFSVKAGRSWLQPELAKKINKRILAASGDSVIDSGVSWCFLAGG